MQKNNKRTIIIYVFVVIAVLIGLWFVARSIDLSSQPKYKYSEIVQLLRDDGVESFELDIGKGHMTGTLREGYESYLEGIEPDSEGVYTFEYKVNSPATFHEDLKDILDENSKPREDSKKETTDSGSESADSNTDKAQGKNSKGHIPLVYEYSYSADNSALLLQLIPMAVIIIAMVIFFIFIARQAGAGGKMSQFGKTNMKNPVQHGIKTTFDDVAGADEEKEELTEIVEFLKNPKKFNDLGARIPKGVLLLGPPGTGKTLLARAVAGEAGVPFFSISGSDFVEMFVGVGASRVRDLFENAKKNSPSIIFIDEIDAVGRHRGAGLGGGHDEREQTLNQLLVEMDGFGENQGVIVIAATNRRDILDPALLRPGRFDRQVVVNYPDVKGREEILRVHARNKPLGFDVDLKVIARSTAGFTGADLENLLNEAALLAARRSRKAITGTDIEEATIKVVAGPEKRSHKIHQVDKKITAYHEAGHAVVNYYLETQDPVHEISIVPRGMAAGYNINIPEEDRTHVSKRKMMETLSVLLGGRVAEQIALDDICTGASNDIERATQTARDMVMRYGFSTRLGTVVYGEAQGEVFLGKDMGHQKNYSENVAAEIDEEVRLFIDNAYEQATQILKAHFDQLDLVAKYLLVHEKIDAPTFKRLMNGDIDPKSLAEDLKKIEEKNAIYEAALREEREQAAAKMVKKDEPPKPEKKPPVFGKIGKQTRLDKDKSEPDSQQTTTVKSVPPARPQPPKPELPKPPVQNRNAGIPNRPAPSLQKTEPLPELDKAPGKIPEPVKPTVPPAIASTEKLGSIHSPEPEKPSVPKKQPAKPPELKKQPVKPSVPEVKAEKPLSLGKKPAASELPKTETLGSLAEKEAKKPQQPAEPKPQDEPKPKAPAAQKPQGESKPAVEQKSQPKGEAKPKPAESKPQGDVKPKSAAEPKPQPKIPKAKPQVKPEEQNKTSDGDKNSSKPNQDKK